MQPTCGENGISEMLAIYRKRTTQILPRCQKSNYNFPFATTIRDIPRLFHIVQQGRKETMNKKLPYALSIKS